MSSAEHTPTNQGDSPSTVPSITLPKGGGALRGIGEKFAANPVTGTGSMSVPIATSPARSGFTPQLSLAYDSGGGNGVFGMGWSLSTPSMTRKTDKGLPQYDDALESDVFALSGSEDLVPLLEQPDAPRIVDGISYQVRAYRPRIEGLFARIERWSNSADSHDVHWRSLSKDNVLTLYGKSENARIFDPTAPDHIFSWLICESRDDKGNAILYIYKAEDDSGVDLTHAHERNRQQRTANRYLKRIRYGNQHTLLDADNLRPIFLTDAQIDNAGWMFEVVFDYGEHDENAPTPNDPGVWGMRDDPFSTYRASFEIRTMRQCRRVLMFHHFAGEAGVGNDCLVRSTDFHYSDGNAVYTFLNAVTQCGYKRSGAGYLKRSLPPVEFAYSQPLVQDVVEEVSAENLPSGIDGATYQWTDLHGEGIPGILTEQATAWFYKRNLSPISEQSVRFAPLEQVAHKPNATLAGGGQLLDLAGDGQLDLVLFAEGGFYEHDDVEGWQPFQPFRAPLNRDMRDPNLKLIDLNGDGHADVLVSDEAGFVWHRSLEESGFATARRVFHAWDEEKAPRILFADVTQSIYLADMSGDGLTDLVRIRSGEVCYWPNLGYGRFGAKVAMDDAPNFDQSDQFSHKRIRLADIDGSGTTDIIYLHRDGVRVYFNQSGNGWSKVQRLAVFPRVDDLVNIMTADLLGNGTACLVWSSPLPNDANRPMRYVNLMGGQKPHLLIKSRNNLGAETEISYAPSTKFYLQDKRDGQPWISKLPFPVHVVEKVTVVDKWRKSRFTSSYSYHHGYFDGVEREFRGFGRIEQIDSETFGRFQQGNSDSPYITDDQTLYQPPVKTTSWYHTGVFLDRERILSQYAHEYFRPVGFVEKQLPEPTLSTDLNDQEWREALRACKGMLLRQEVVELDVDALERSEHLPVKLFTTAYHNCQIKRVQPQADNRHAVFLVTESEAITFHYDLDLRTPTLTPDPRIAHTLNLQTDEYGNTLQAVAAVYPRRGKFGDDVALANGLADQLPLIDRVQTESHLTYTESRFSADFQSLDNFRLRLPCETLTYELTGIAPQDDYFTLSELHALRLSAVHQTAGLPVNEIAYHQLATPAQRQKRLIEHARTLFFADDLTNPLPFGEHGRVGLTYESYKLELTDELLTAIFQDEKLAQVVNGVSVRDRLDNATTSGYLRDATGAYWIRSGIAGFAPDAARHFYLPEQYSDPFGNVTTLQYDVRDLFIESSSDPLGNTTRVTQFDYRVLAPRAMQDSNDNLSEIFFDVLGLPTALAVKGKGTEGDNLSGFNDGLANPVSAELIPFFDQPNLNETQARSWLGNATARHLYYFGEMVKDGKTIWGEHPACACGIVREQHVSQLAAGQQSPIQASFEYSDGMGSVVAKKVQAEPEQAGQPLRWVANGKTILNNKGKPVKQYEPYFCAPEVGHRFEESQEVGVTPVVYYDAIGRTIRTELPDGSFSHVAFSPWHVQTFDPNDTVKRSAWYSERNPVDPDQPLPRNPLTGALAVTRDQRAAWLAAQHADTPALTLLDSLGRDVISIADNGGEKYVTYTKLDAEGKPLWIRDARRNLVMQFITPPVPNNQVNDPANGFTSCYDIAGNLLFQHSMDAGDRWMLNDAAGKPLLAWDSRGHTFLSDYDGLHRPIATYVTDGATTTQYEKIIYGDTPNNGLSDQQKLALNLRGKPYQHFDSAGIVTSMGRNPLTNTDEAFDFKGNALRSTRQLVQDYKGTPDWSQNPSLADEIFMGSTRYDGLNRPIQLTAPHSNQPDTKFNVTQPTYNEANLLEGVAVWLEISAEASTLLNPATATLHAIGNINYNAKGQRELIEYNTASQPFRTVYDYDEQTFRLRQLKTTSDQRILQDLTYTYDPVGNITDIRDAAQQTVFFNNGQIEPHNAYTYDALYRLIHAEGREHAVQNNSQRDDKPFDPVIGIPFPNSPEALQRYAESFIYDSVGNIVQMQHSGGDITRWTRDYQYALDSNRLLATRLPNDLASQPTYVAAPSYTARYSYDAHGNIIAMPHLPTMAWDFKDQLRASQQQAVNAGGSAEKTYYVYDGSGQRVRKVTESAVGQLKEERIYLGNFELYRKYSGQSVALERETLHVMDDKQRVALIETRTKLQGNDPALRQLIRYQLGNHLGSAALEVNDAAQIISYEEFHPYGTTAYQASRSQTDTPKRYRYTGKERDEETGFTYHGARYYIPWLGRWTRCDPAGFVDSTNLYLYVAANPIRNVDPLGGDLFDRVKNSVSKGIDRAQAAVKPGGAVFEAVDSAFNPNEHPVSAAVLNNMAKRGEGMVEGAKQGLKESAEDYADIAFYATHSDTHGAKEKVNAAVKRRQEAPAKMAVGMVKGFAGQVKNVGEGLGTVAYYRPELLGAAGMALPSHSKEAGADAKVANAITDIVLDGPQIVLAVEGAANLTKGTLGAATKTPVVPKNGPMFSSGELAGVESATPELLEAVGKKRAVSYAVQGSDELKFLDMRNAEAASFGTEDIILRPNPSKAAVLEEFLHGTQTKLGITDRLGTTGLGSAETHVKNFMIRHQKMLGLGAEDVRRLQILRDKGL